LPLTIGSADFETIRAGIDLGSTLAIFAFTSIWLAGLVSGSEVMLATDPADWGTCFCAWLCSFLSLIFSDSDASSRCSSFSIIVSRRSRRWLSVSASAGWAMLSDSELAPAVTIVDHR
jgi:hypothetical protein